MEDMNVDSAITEETSLCLGVRIHNTKSLLTSGQLEIVVTHTYT